MDFDKREKQKPVPDNLDEILNDLQLMALNKVEGFGWRLGFVRRPLFQEVVPVVFSPDGQQIGVLESTGEINMQPDIILRKPS